MLLESYSCDSLSPITDLVVLDAHCIVMCYMVMHLWKLPCKTVTVVGCRQDYARINPAPT